MAHKGFAKKPKSKTEKFKILDFDGIHYEIQNLSMSNVSKAKCSEEVLINALAANLGVPKIGRRNICWVTCKKNLKIGAVVEGKLNGNPAKLAEKYQFAELIISSKLN